MEMYNNVILLLKVKLFTIKNIFYNIKLLNMSNVGTLYTTM